MVIFLQKLSPSPTTAAGKTKEYLVADGKGSDCTGQDPKALPLLTFPHGNATSKQLYTE